MSVQEKTLSLGALKADSTALFVCDLQDKFKPAMLYFDEIVATSKKLLQVSKVLQLKVIVTEQYPKGLGSTVPELDIQHATAVIAKTKFSMIVPEVVELMKLELQHVKVAILFGVEAHVCVEQTAIDLLSMGIIVHVVADATSSRSQEDRLLAFEVSSFFLWALKKIGTNTLAQSLVHSLGECYLFTPIQNYL